MEYRIRIAEEKDAKAIHDIYGEYESVWSKY